MKTDKVINGILIKATLPPNGESYEWPDGVTKIGDSAFSRWNFFNQPFVVPDSVMDIGNWAFSSWRSFNQPFVVPDSVRYIGKFAFSSWLSFNQQLTLPDSVKTIGSYAISSWRSFNQSNCCMAKATHDWFRIDNWVFAGCWSGTLKQLRKRLDSGESTPEREKAWNIISKPLKT